MSLISRYEHLPRRPRSDEARPLLEKIASQVKPIMTKRDWKVGTLAEFFPSNPALLGLNTNSGQRINLRLRPPGSPDGFYEFDQLVLVMLHELVHNEIGPHNAAFYKLLSELEEEFYDLKRKGYSGEGFNSTGHHLPGLQRSEYDGRRAGLLAAQKRLDTQLRLGKGGRLGGSSLGAGSGSGKSMREIVAEAAQRRIQDDKTCATEHGAEATEEARRAAEESVGVDVDVDVEVGVGVDVPAGEKAQEVAGEESESEVEFLGDGRNGEPSRSGPISTTGRRPQQSIPDTVSSEKEMPKRTAKSPPINNRPTRAPRPSPPSPSSPSSTPAPAPSARATRPASTPIPKEWSCPVCTLLNPLRHLQCDACTAERPAHYADAASNTGGATASASGVSVWSGLPGEQSRGLADTGTSVSDEDGWYCAVCTSGPRGWEFWTCAVCESVRKFG